MVFFCLSWAWYEREDQRLARTAREKEQAARWAHVQMSSSGFSLPANEKEDTAAMPLSEISLDAWQVGDILTSSKGAKSAALTADGQPIYLQFTPQAVPLSAPFGASSFNDEASNRKSISFRCTPELEQFFQRLDEFMEAYLREHAERLFKGKVPEYRPCLHRHDHYPALVRCKLNVAGQRACRYWGQDHAPMEAPDDLRECGLVPRVQVKSLWVMGKEVGLVLDVVDLICIPPAAQCPFEEAASSSPSFE